MIKESLGDEFQLFSIFGRSIGESMMNTYCNTCCIIFSFPWSLDEAERRVTGDRIQEKGINHRAVLPIYANICLIFTGGL